MSKTIFLLIIILIIQYTFVCGRYKKPRKPISRVKEIQSPKHVIYGVDRGKYYYLSPIRPNKRRLSLINVTKLRRLSTNFGETTGFVIIYGSLLLVALAGFLISAYRGNSAITVGRSLDRDISWNLDDQVQLLDNLNTCGGLLDSMISVIEVLQNRYQSG